MIYNNQTSNTQHQEPEEQGFKPFDIAALMAYHGKVSREPTGIYNPDNHPKSAKARRRKSEVEVILANKKTPEESVAAVLETLSNTFIDDIQQDEGEAVRADEVILANKKAPEESVGVHKTSSGAWMNNIKQVQAERAIKSSASILAKKEAAGKKKINKKTAITHAKRNFRNKFEDVHGRLQPDEFLVINNYIRRAAKVRVNKDKSLEILGYYYASGSYKRIENISKDTCTMFENGLSQAYEQYLEFRRTKYRKLDEFSINDAKSDERYTKVSSIRPQKFAHACIKNYIFGGNADFNEAAMDYYKNLLLPDAHRLTGISVMDGEGKTVFEQMFKNSPIPKDFLVTLNLSEMSAKYADLSPEQFIANTLFATNALMSLQEADKKDGHKVFDRNLMNVVTGNMKRFKIYRFELNEKTGEIVPEEQPAFNSFVEAFGLSRHKSHYIKKSSIRHLQAYKTELLGMLVMAKILKENLDKIPEVGFVSREKAILSNTHYWEEHSSRGRYSVVAGSTHTEIKRQHLRVAAKKEDAENSEVSDEEPILFNATTMPALDEFMDTLDTAGIPKFLHASLETDFSVDKTFSEMVSQAKELYAEYVFEQDLDYLDARNFNENMEIRDERIAAVAEDEALWVAVEFNTSLLQVKKFLRDVTSFATAMSHSYKDENGVINYVPAFTLSTAGRMYEKLGLWRMTKEMKERFYGSGCVNVDAISCHPSIVINVVAESHKKGFIKLSQKDIDELLYQADRVNNKKTRAALCENTGCNEDSLKKCITSIYNLGKTNYSEARIREFGEAGKKNLGCIERLIAENNLTESGKKEILAFLQPFADAMKKMEHHIHALYQWRNARENVPEGQVCMGLYTAPTAILDGLTPSQLMSYFLQSEETLLTVRTAVRLYKESNGKIKVLSHEHDGMVLTVAGVNELSAKQRACVADKADKAYRAEADLIYSSKTASLALREKYFYSADLHPYKIIRWDSLEPFIQQQVEQFIAVKDDEVLETLEQKRYSFAEIRETNERIVKEKFARNFAAVNNYEWVNKYKELVECLINFNGKKLYEYEKAKASNDVLIDFILDEVKFVYEYMQEELPEEVAIIMVVVFDKLLVGKRIKDESQSTAEQKASAEFACYKTCV